jgi:hypothetical protein
VTCTPAARPWSAWSTEGTGARSSSCAVTEETAPVSCSRRWVPYPIATIPCSSTAWACSENVTLAVWPSTTVTARVCSP